MQRGFAAKHCRRPIPRIAYYPFIATTSNDSFPAWVTYYVLFVISLADRVVQIAGITTRPDEVWMLQVGRNLIAEDDGALASKRYLIIDRDTKYTRQFRSLFKNNGTEVIRLPPFSPNLNAFAERYVRSIKEECLGKMIFVGQAWLRRATGEYMTHYHGERTHQGMGDALIRGKLTERGSEAIIHRRQRLGGMLNYYHRAAA